MLVMVCVSIMETPSMAFSFSKNSVSGANSFSAHGPKSLNGTVVMSLKSRQAPHTKRLTLTSFDTALICGRYSSTTLAMDSKEAESDLSPLYLHRHSRQTRLKDMLPLASGTDSEDIFLVDCKVLRQNVGVGMEETASLIIIYPTNEYIFSPFRTFRGRFRM